MCRLVAKKKVRRMNYRSREYFVNLHQFRTSCLWETSCLGETSCLRERYWLHIKADLRGVSFSAFRPVVHWAPCHVMNHTRKPQSPTPFQSEESQTPWLFFRWQLFTFYHPSHSVLLLFLSATYAMGRKLGLVDFYLFTCVSKIMYFA